MKTINEMLLKEMTVHLSDRATARISYEKSVNAFFLHVEYHGIADKNKSYDKRNIFLALGTEETRRLIDVLNVRVALAEEMNR